MKNVNFIYSTYNRAFWNKSSAFDKIIKKEK